MALHDGHLNAGNDGPDLALADIRPAVLQVADFGHQGLNKFIVHRAMHVTTLNRHAALSGAAHAAPRQGTRGQRNVGVSANNGRVFAAEFQVHGHKGFGGNQRHAPPRAHTAGEAHEVAATHHRFARGRGTGDQLQHVCQARHAGDDTFQNGHKTGRGFTGFDQHRATRHQRRNGVDQGQHQRKIPGADDARHTIGAAVLFDANVGLARAPRRRRGQQRGGVVDPAVKGANNGLHFDRGFGAPTGVHGDGLYQRWRVLGQRSSPLRQHGQTLAQGPRCPGRLGRAQAVHNRRHLLRAEHGHVVVDGAAAGVACGQGVGVGHGVMAWVPE